MALQKMTPAALEAWRVRMGFTWAQACQALQVGETTFAAWLRGERKIPGHVALACAALKAGLEPYGKSDCKNN